MLTDNRAGDIDDALAWQKVDFAVDTLEDCAFSHVHFENMQGRWRYGIDVEADIGLKECVLVCAAECQALGQDRPIIPFQGDGDCALKGLGEAVHDDWAMIAAAFNRRING